ncbi:glycosyltransferase [Bradyrhizobium manausense]|uniref:glycosyltransferase family 2 protein n=1 Tax=Bradyrhizobium manausense TaxID=989370 RepID=UPI001BA4966A|nr:glycosyltransferase family 2 protein [Bradyrhizobium manausense]MBR0685633.1 glycosyltransferase [Bradyrhizobium manausense]
MFFLIVVIAGLVLIPTLVLFVEVLGALWADAPSAGDDRVSSGWVAVVVPAHNESVGIIPTLQDVASQLRECDRMIVVADNCSDDTAAVSAAHGAHVLPRNQPDRRGKGYAMAWAIAHLKDDPPGFVLFVDADCRLQRGFLANTLNYCARTGEPIQALYLMTSAEGFQVKQRVAEFAWRLKNWVRPLGLDHFGRPVQLMGTGMMFPWEVIKSAPLASSHLVEDLKLGLDLALSGTPARFLPTVRIISEFATTDRGAESQRQRWIEGHLDMIVSYAPRLLVSSIMMRNFDALVLALDLLVPPLSLLVAIAGGIAVLGGVYALLTGALFPAALALLNLAVLAGALTSAWLKFGRDILPASQIPFVVGQILRRFRLVRHFVRRGSSEWIRTDRSRPD